jgi:hypothetical protein
LLILPVAILAYTLLSIVIPLVFVVTNLLEIRMNPVVAALGDYFPQLLASIAAPYSFVWCGTYTAPARRAGVAIALGGCIVVSHVLLTPFLIVHNPQHPIWWVLLLILISVGAAIVAVVRCRRGGRWLPAGD